MKFKTLLILAICLFVQGITHASDSELKPSQGDFIANSFSSENIELTSEKNISLNFRNNDLSIYDFLISSKKSQYFNLDKMSETDEVMGPFFEAVERYEQGNITASYKSFESIINTTAYNDFYYMLMAYKLADIGFFSLSNDAINKVVDRYIWQGQIDTLKQCYFPEYMHTLEEQTFLANIHSSINYSNLTRESIADVMKKDRIIRRSDYALYLVAEALFAEKEYSKSYSAVNRAISLNPNNVYYSELKAKILIEQKKYEEAICVVKNIVQKDGISPETLRKLASLKHIAKSKSEKNPLRAKYYLAQYFYVNKDYSKALNELSIVNYKNKLPEAYTLAGDIYFLNKEFDKSLDSYIKALALNKKYSPAYNGLGNILVLKKDYAGAQKAYLKASKNDKKDVDAILNLALVNLLEQDKLVANTYCDKAAIMDNKSFQTYYLKSKIQPDEEQNNLRKAIRLNPFYSDSWLDLTSYYLSKADLKAAESSLSSVRFLEEKSYRYYYYNAMIAKNNSDNESADNNFKKAVNLYSAKNSMFISVPTANIKEF